MTSHEQSFGDPAFEPQTTYGFEDRNGDGFHDYRDNMDFTSGFSMMSGAGDRNINFDGNPQLYAVGTATFSNMSNMTSNAHIQPSEVWSDGNNAPTRGLEHVSGGRSQQQELVQSRQGSVNQRWGQITPPDDSTPPVSKKRKDSGRDTTTAEAATKPKLDNSERARNAANSRHARAKQSRLEHKQDNQSGASSAEGSDEDVGDKREKYREKNRVAAARCRQKKKENVQTLEDKHRNLSAQNNFMKREERQLRDELSKLRTDALNHVSSNQHCQCSPLHSYNQQQVRALAHGFGGNHRPASSPSQDSTKSRTSSMVECDAMGRIYSHPMSSPESLVLQMPTAGPFSQPTYSFATVTTPQSMETTGTAGAQSQEFSGFLQSSPQDSSGFSPTGHPSFQ